MVNRFKAFYDRSPNYKIDYEEAQQRFVSRMLYVLFPNYPRATLDEIRIVGKALGKMVTNISQIKTYLFSDFGHLQTTLMRLIPELPEGDIAFLGLTASFLSDQIEKELEDADMDLEIEWRDGKFFPRGARLLDEKLVDDPLDWISNNDLPTVYEPFTNALDHFLRARKNPKLLNDVITDAYDALEAIAKVVCENDKTFGANTDQYIEKINASREFKKTLREMSKYAHKFRHGASPSEPKPKPTMSEVEAYIYTVGILIRLGTETLEKWKREKPRQKWKIR